MLHMVIHLCALISAREIGSVLTGDKMAGLGEKVRSRDSDPVMTEYGRFLHLVYVRSYVPA